MNQMFIDDLTYNLEDVFDNVNVWNQKNVFGYLLLDNEQMYHFPMICFEHTPDSDFEVSVDESKFLNDPIHDGTWIVCGSEDDVECMFNLKNNNNILEIDVIEVNDQKRGEGIGGNMVSLIESIAENYFDKIIISPFDTDAINFWEHMEYKESDKITGYWEKKLNEYE